MTATYKKEGAVTNYVTLHYDYNGGTADDTCFAADTIIKSGTSKKVEIDDGSGLTKEGYTFSGWAKTKNASKPDYEGGEVITLTSDVTLYAVWIATSDNTPCTVLMYTLKEAYKPGDLAYLSIRVTESDHFWLDTSAGNFTFTRQDGMTGCTSGIFFAKSAKNIREGYTNNLYTNNMEYVVNLRIPSDCKYGTYPIKIEVTDGEYDNDSGSINATSKVASTIYVTVNEDGKEEIKVDIAKTKIVLHKGDTEKLKVSVTSSEYDESDVEWTSSNKNVATVTKYKNKGKVIAKGIGKTTITATVDGVSDTCEVVVEECDFSVKSTDDEYLKKAATCKSYAEYYYSCKCGYHDPDNTFFDTKGGYGAHKYGNWSTVTEPTETTAGKKQRICSVCGDIETEVIDALGHTHSYSEDWFYNDTNHWHECDCGDKTDVAAHTDANNDGKCDACGHAVAIVTPPHTHDYSTEWKSNDTNHWHECDCGDKTDVAAHTDSNTDGKCDACGHAVAIVTPPHTHDYSTEWKSNDTNHWHECDCGDKTDNAAHVDSNTDGKCDVCGHAVAIVTPPHTHDYSTEWKSNDTNHWHECDCGDKTDVAAHTDSNNDGKCDTCGHAVAIVTPPHTHDYSTEWKSNDTNHWHECDCGDKTDNAAHTASGWIVDKAATATMDGLCHKECLVCGYVLATETIKATGSTGSDFAYADWFRYLTLLESQKFTITQTAGEGGSISSSHKGTVPYNTDVTYTITPKDGYVIDTVLVDGKDVGAVSTYTFRNVRKDHTISAVFTAVPTVVEPTVPFTDVAENDWYCEDVAYVYENGLMIGTSDTTFAPDAMVNRAMLVTILWRLEGSPEIDSAAFTDVPAGEWYSTAVNWAAANGIVNGMGDGTFAPLSALTHEQILTILARYAAFKGYTDGVTQPMLPAYTYSVWAETSVIWADGIGMLDGFGTDTSDLTVAAKRAEMAAYLHRFCMFLVK